MAGGRPGDSPRGPSTKGYLRITWDYPVYRPAAKSDGTDVARPREALPREEALRALADKDPRPLLVVRECAVCNKTDNALLRPGADNERTILLSRWFHCIKLPVDVIRPDHPFHALFPDNDAEHLFVSARDGSAKIPLESDTSRVELNDSMTKTISNAYSKDPTDAVREALKVLDKLDMLDGRIRDLEHARDGMLEASGKLDKDRFQKLEEALAAANKEVDASLQTLDRLGRGDLRPPRRRQ